MRSKRPASTFGARSSGPNRALSNSSKAGDLVLDLFGGSGSTVIACQRVSRICLAMEIDPKYVDVIITRWMQFTGEQAIHEETGATFEQMKQNRSMAIDHVQN